MLYACFVYYKVYATIGVHNSNLAVPSDRLFDVRYLDAPFRTYPLVRLPYDIFCVFSPIKVVRKYLIEFVACRFDYCVNEV